MSICLENCSSVRVMWGVLASEIPSVHGWSPVKLMSQLQFNFWSVQLESKVEKEPILNEPLLLC